MEVIEVIEKEIEVIEVIERGPQGPQGAGITTLTTQGDLLYRGATTGERLPIGTTGQILKVSSGGIPEWGAAPSSGVSSVSGTSPIVSSGGSTPAISITAATTSAAGSMSAADKTKLDGIASGAEVNVNADWNASSGDAQILNKPTIPSTAADVGAVPTSRTISAGTGLTGGGDLSANRTLAVSYGTTAGTACQGNDGRISGIGSSTISTSGTGVRINVTKGRDIVDTYENSYTQGQTFTGGASGLIESKGSDAVDGAFNVGNSGENGKAGGSLLLNAGTSSDLVGGAGGSINLSGGYGGGGDGGQILITGGAGNDLIANLAGDGGLINLSGGSGGIIKNGGHGGQILMTGGDGSGNHGGSAGTLDLSGGDGNQQNGGSINLSNGGGSIDLRGTGSIEFGIAGTRTTLTGTATANRAISMPNAAGTLALTSDITKTAVGLGNVTNNAQTQAAIVPNTAPSAGQLLVGNAGGTAYAPATLSGDATIASTGALTLANTSTARTNIGLGNVANVDTTNANNISSGVLPNARVNWAAPSAIGSTTAASGAFTTLNANNGTLTASAPVLDLSQTWNNAAVTFTGLRFNVTNTASAAASLLTDFQVGGTSAFRIRRDGATVVPFTTNGPTTIGYGFGSGINATHGLWCESGRIGLTAGNDYQLFVTTTGATVLSELRVGDQGCILRSENSAANASGTILAQRNGTNPQEYRLYNTYSSSGANYERGFMRWSSNVLQIGTEKLGTGSARALEFQTDGVTRIAIAANGDTQINGFTSFNQNATIVTGRVLTANQINLNNTSTALLALGTDSTIRWGSSSATAPLLKRSSTALQVRLADDSADAPFSSGAITTSGTVTANNTASGFVTSSAPNGASPIRFAANSGDVLIQSANAAGIVEFRGTTGTNPQSLRVFNTFTSGTSFERLNIRWASNECIIDAEAGSGGGTLRGIKIGSATSSLLGFYGATPVTQRAAIADATDAATTQARLNDLLAAMRSLGLIAT